ncbi:MAG: hypothetical protein K2O14_01575 [Oscillospiraceae bacterium]|nr:hypothetical protein [Oscillospiraceae bacterium]
MKRYTIFSAFLLISVLTGCAAAEFAPMGASDVSGEAFAESAESDFDIFSAQTADNAHNEPRGIITAEPKSVTPEGADGITVSEETEPPQTAEAAEELSEYEAVAKKILTDIITNDEIIIEGEYTLDNYLYHIDLFDVTGDGIPELFVNTVQRAGSQGFLDIYDIAAGERLATLVDRTYNLSVCTDEENNTHYIIRSEEWINMSGCAQFVAYFDMRYCDGELNISVPFFGGPTGWFEETGEHKFINRIFKDNGYYHECREDGECFHHNRAYHHFIEGELIGEYEVGDSLGYTLDGLGGEDSEEIKQLIQEYVFDGLTVRELRTGTRNDKVFSNENIDEVWDSVAYMFADIDLTKTAVKQR